MTVSYAHFGGKVDCKALLQDVLDNPEVESVVVVSFNKDGETSISWSNMNNSQVAFAALVLQDAVLRG